MYELFSSTTLATDILTSFYKNLFHQQSIFNWKFDKSKNLLILILNIMHFKKLSFWILALPIYKDYNCDATCLHNEFVFVVDGYMGEWGSWSACSATCGGGYQMRTRTCHDPLFGGKNCTGEVVDLNPSCNTLSCPSQSEALIYSIFFLFEIIFKLTKKREMIIRVPFFNVFILFYFNLR